MIKVNCLEAGAASRPSEMLYALALVVRAFINNVAVKQFLLADSTKVPLQKNPSRTEK